MACCAPKLPTWPVLSAKTVAETVAKWKTHKCWRSSHARHPDHHLPLQAASPRSASTARCTQEAGTTSSERCLCCPTPAGKLCDGPCHLSPTHAAGISIHGGEILSGHMHSASRCPSLPLGLQHSSCHHGLLVWSCLAKDVAASCNAGRIFLCALLMPRLCLAARQHTGMLNTPGMRRCPMPASASGSWPASGGNTGI